MKSSLKLFVSFSIGTWVNALVNLVSIPLITWLVSPSEFGKATMFTLAYNLIINVVLLGTDQSFVRFFNEKDDENKKVLFSSSMVSPLIFLLFCSLLIALNKVHVAEALFSDSNSQSVVVVLIFSLFAGLLSQFGVTLVRMKSRAMAYSVIQSLSAVGNVIFVVCYAMFIAPTFESVVYGFVISLCINLFVSVWLERSFWSVAVRRFFYIDKVLVSQMLLYGLPFVPTFLVDWVFQSSDRTFLRIYSTYGEIGLFAAATKVANSLNIIKNGFTAYWVPLSFEKFSKNPSDTTVYSKYFDLLSLLFFPAIILLISFSDIILLLLPDAYGETSKIFPILFFIPLLYTLSEITVVGINFQKKPYWHLIIVVVSAAVNVAFGLLLIPGFGAMGAAVSTLLAYLVFFFMRSFLSIRLYKVEYNWFRFSSALAITLAVLMLHTFSELVYMPYVIAPSALLIIVALYRNVLLSLLAKVRPGGIKTVRKLYN